MVPSSLPVHGHAGPLPGRTCRLVGVSFSSGAIFLLTCKYKQAYDLAQTRRSTVIGDQCRQTAFNSARQPMLPTRKTSRLCFGTDGVSVAGRANALQAGWAPVDGSE